MAGLPSGKKRGMWWYEIPWTSAGWGHQGSPDSRFILIAANELTGQEQANFRNDPGKLGSSSVIQSIGYQPFSLEEVSDAIYVYYKPHYWHFDHTAWAKEHLELPDSLDIDFDPNISAGRLALNARTLRNGRVVTVRRIVKEKGLVDDAIRSDIAFFERNCRKPEGAAEFTWGSHLARIVANVDRHGRGRLHQWLDKVRNAGAYGVASLSLPGAMFSDGNILRIMFDRLEGTNAIKADVTIEGGHRITETDKSLDLTLKAQLPEAVANALKGRPLGDVIDAEWARDVKIKAVRRVEPALGEIELRLAYESIPLELPPEREENLDDVKSRLRQEKAGHIRWSKISAAAMPILSSLRPGELAAVMDMLNHETVDMGPFGHPGWWLRGRGGDVVVEDNPLLSYDDLVKTVLEADDRIAPDRGML